MGPLIHEQIPQSKVLKGMFIKCIQGLHTACRWFECCFIDVQRVSTKCQQLSLQWLWSFKDGLLGGCCFLFEDPQTWGLQSTTMRTLKVFGWWVKPMGPEWTNPNWRGHWAFLFMFEGNNVKISRRGWNNVRLGPMADNHLLRVASK